MTGFEPLDIVHIDLADGLEPLAHLNAAEGRDVYAVFWRAGIPLGHAELTRAQLDHPPTLVHLVAAKIAPAVGARLLPGFEVSPIDRVSAPETTIAVTSLPEVVSPLEQLDIRMAEPPQRAATLRVSVIVCTRGRPEYLAYCLRSLLQTSGRPDEIIVVDNEPETGEAHAVANGFPGVTYVSEPRPGLSRARNTGLRAASGDIIAFTDDDTTVHRDWIRRLRQGFQNPKVMSVTGLVLPARLDTPAQVAFEKAMGGFSQGYRRITYDAEFLKRTKDRGTPVWRIGAGANMAIRSDAFRLVGEFDERLGAGAAGCSEDSEFWYRLLAAGWRCLYEPAVVVFHSHRSDFSALKAQARAYIRGHVAALFVQYARHGHRGNLYRALLAMPSHLAKRAAREYIFLRRPSRLFAAYVFGYLSGLRFLPLAFRRDRKTPPPSSGTSEGVHPQGKAARRSFLRANPYPHPLSVGLFYREKMRAIHSVAPDGHFERILEVGGGQSGLTALLYPVAEVVNVDLEAAYAGSRFNQRPGTRFVCGDATRLPFPDHSFDGITLFDVLEHVPDDHLAAAEVLRVLRPDGFVLITSPNQRWRFPYYRRMRNLCPTDREVMAEWGHVRRGYALAELGALLGSAPLATASYITPITTVGHDLAFSKLPGRSRPLACAAVSPLTWLGYWLHRPGQRGIETASRWRPTDEG